MTFDANHRKDHDRSGAFIDNNACPMVHGTGLFVFLLSVNCGAPMVMVERFDAETVLDRVEQHGCTWLPGLPFMHNALLEHQRKRPRLDRHSLCPRTPASRS